MRLSIRAFWLAALIFVYSRSACAQSSPGAILSKPVPETAYISSPKYTNAFYGFSLVLPRGIPFKEFPMSYKDPAHHFLFGLQVDLVKAGLFSDHPALTMMTISSEQLQPGETTKDYASRKKMLNLTRIEIRAREFWKGESEESGPGGRSKTLDYLTLINGSVVEFYVTSFDGKLTGQLKHAIESLEFFDPPRAMEFAGENSRLYDPSGSHIAKLNEGSISSNTYTNNELEFTYQFPVGWALIDEATQEKVIEAGHKAVWGDNASAAQEHEVAQKCTRILLWVNRFVPGSKFEGLNPLIVLMAIDPACSPTGMQFPSSMDDHDGIKQVAGAIFSSLSNAPFFGKGQKVVSATKAGNHLWVQLSGTVSLDIPASNVPQAAYTSIEVTAVRDYWLAWLFMGGSQAELDQMKSTVVNFGSPSSPF